MWQDRVGERPVAGGAWRGVVGAVGELWNAVAGSSGEGQAARVANGNGEGGEGNGVGNGKAGGGWVQGGATGVGRRGDSGVGMERGEREKEMETGRQGKGANGMRRRAEWGMGKKLKIGLLGCLGCLWGRNKRDKTELGRWLWGGVYPSLSELTRDGVGVEVYGCGEC